MAETPDRGVALLSMHPGYAESILSGKKKVEFRRVGFKREVTHVVVYATAPVSRIIGWFSVTHIDARSTSALWRAYSTVGGVSAEEFENYFDGVSHGVAIKVGTARRLSKPVSLRQLGRAVTPPQSYRYIDRSVFERLRSA